MSQVSLSYLVGFREPPTTIPMLPLEGDPSSFAAEIPAAALSEGALVRWAATATGGPSSSTAPSVRCPRRGDDWLGTAVLDPEEPSKLPLLEWFRAPSSSPGGGSGGGGGGSGDWIWYGGSLRPLSAVSRKGTTSLGWPKPKLKLELKKGYDTEDSGGKKLVLRPPFTIVDEGGEGGEGSGPMTSVDLDSLWWEPGSNSYVRQAAAFAALRSVARVRREGERGDFV